MDPWLQGKGLMSGQTYILDRVLQEQDPVREATVMEQHLHPGECPQFLQLKGIDDWQRRWQKQWFLMQKKIANDVEFDNFVNHRVQDLRDRSQPMTTRTTTKIQLDWLRFSILVCASRAVSIRGLQMGSHWTRSRTRNDCGAQLKRPF